MLAGAAHERDKLMHGSTQDGSMIEPQSPSTGVRNAPTTSFQIRQTTHAILQQLCFVAEGVGGMLPVA